MNISSVIGTWDIVSSPAFDDEYLNLDGPSYVRLRQDDDRIVGDYHLGLQTGDVDGRLQRDGSIRFSFEGTDELDEVSGAGTAAVTEDRLIFTLMYHQGEDYTFEGNRRP